MIEWQAYPEHTPPLKVALLVEVARIPDKFTPEYTALIDGSDRTKDELERRRYATAFYETNPVQVAHAYQAVGGIKFMIRCNTDSRQGFIGDAEISRWALINN